MSSHLKAPEGRKKSPILEVSVAPPGLTVVGFVTQGLRPGLQFCRPSGTGLQHGLKPILPFGATILSSFRDWFTAWAEAHPTFWGYSSVVPPGLVYSMG